MYIQVSVSRRKKKKKRIQLMLVISVILAALTFAVRMLAVSRPDITEKYFSRGLYPFTSSIQTGIANLFPFSLYEISILLLVLFFLYMLFRLIRSIYAKNFVREAARFFTFILFTVSLGWFLFNFLWNLNNYRIPLKDRLSLQVNESSVSELSSTYKALVLRANEIRSGLSLTNENISGREMARAVLDTAWEGYRPLSDIYPFFHSKRVRVKGLIFSRIQTISGYAGVYSFLTGEPNINIEPPLVTLPHSACHEIAHQMGITFEDEANYTGFLACKHHTDPLFQYSGYLSAITYAGNELYRHSPHLYEEISSLLIDEIKADQRYIRNFWDTHKKERITKIADDINDYYLKSNNQPDGLQSYGKFVDLLIADFLEDGEI
jgi:hypothetical protein